MEPRADESVDEPLDETEAFAQEVAGIDFKDELIRDLFQSSKVDAELTPPQQETCWGGKARGTTDQCSPGFVVGKGHLKNKFCSACRERGIKIPAERLQIALPSCELQNSVATGFWSKWCQPATRNGWSVSTLRLTLNLDSLGGEASLRTN